MRYLYLGNNCPHPNDEENGISEDPDKDVPFSVNFPRIHLVEHGHHDKRVENHGEVDAGQAVRLGAVVNVKEFGTYRNQTPAILKRLNG